jgi:RHS repeat-associated protein
MRARFHILLLLALSACFFPKAAARIPAPAFSLIAELDTIQESTAGAPLIDRNYDALGRLTRYQHGSDYTLEWIYHDTDATNKNAFTLRYPGSKDVRYDFDNRGRLKTVKDWNNRTTTCDYDDLGRLEWTHRPNGTKRKLTYDKEGQITKIEELNIDERVIALFGYPAYWDNGQPAQQFSVPAQPLGAKVHPATMTFDVENRLATWNGQTVTHDADGNMTHGPLPALLPGPGQPSPGLGDFDYDARKRLLACNGVSYTYDAENLRTKVTTAAGDTSWVINPAGAPPQPLVRTKPDGTVTRYVWGLGLLYEVADGDTQPSKTYHYDRRGSTVALTNSDGRTVTDRWAYGPYGERFNHSGTSDTPFQFNGFFGVQTDASGLLYMNARYYNVETRRFINADPLGFGAGSNFYAFADGDPFSLVDPFGLATKMEAGGRSFLNAMFEPYVSAATTMNNAIQNVFWGGLSAAGSIAGEINNGLVRAGAPLEGLGPLGFADDLALGLKALGTLGRGVQTAEGAAQLEFGFAKNLGNPNFVLYKASHLEANPGLLRAGESKLNLPNLGSVELNWAQNQQALQKAINLRWSPKFGPGVEL